MNWDAKILGNLPLALNCTLGSILVIVLVLVTYTRLYSIDHFRRSIFCSLLAFCLVAMVSDMAFLLFEGIPGRIAYSLLYLFSASHYLFQMLSCYYIMIFVDYMIFKEKKRSGKMLTITYFVFILYALILLFNFILETYFDFTPAGNAFYGEGRFYLRLIISYCPLLFAIWEIFRHRSLFKKAQFTVFFVLPAFFIFGSTFDFLLSTTRLVWPCLTASLLYAYFFILQSHISVDPLTKTGNRLSFNEFTDGLSRSATGESWAIVMIDMDHFKQINDTLGHQEGDNALSCMAEIIKSCIRKDDFVARYGGDEFVLAAKVSKDTAENIITAQMNEIRNAINLYNGRNIYPFKLEISYGYDVYTADGKRSIEEFLNHIDALMYKNKNERRRLSDSKKEAAG